MEKSCEMCFRPFKKKKPSLTKRAKYCSISCLSKRGIQVQLERRNLAWSSESKEETMIELSNRFEKFVIKQEGCWDWKGCKVKGYGTFNFRGKFQRAHRVAWIIENGEIPNKLWVLHKCDNPSCSNPDHLFLGNNDDNMKDMAKKGRNHLSNVKLKESEVIEIKKLLSLGVTLTRLARDYKVSSTCILDIRQGKTWKNI